MKINISAAQARNFTEKRWDKEENIELLARNIKQNPPLYQTTHTIYKQKQTQAQTSKRNYVFIGFCFLNDFYNFLVNLHIDVLSYFHNRTVFKAS